MRMDFPSLKSRLAGGEVVLGCLLAFDAPWLVEMLGRSGFDFVVIDLEHEPFDDSAVVELIRTCDSLSISSVVRMPLSERVVPFLDAGVQGVKVPDLRGRAHAEELVAMTRFHPRGHRTYYTQGRSAGYGIGVEELQWMQEANERLFVMAMIEDIEVVKQLDSILEVDGIDAFHVGPHDLAQSMGYPSPQELNAVTKDVIRRCRAAGRFVSVGTVTPWNLDRIEDWLEDGVQFLILSSAQVVTNSILQIHNDIRQIVPRDRQSVTELKSMYPSKYMNRPPK